MDRQFGADQFIVGNYVVGVTIGQGSFGKVKMARNMLTGETCAMKIIEKRLMTPGTLEKIAREIRILRSLRHPFVVEMRDVFNTPRHIFIVMEYVAGGELFQFILVHHRVKESQARRFFSQLVLGVEHCHSQHIIHRDLKPENLLLDSQRNIRIIDFGLSSVLPPSGKLTSKCGSPHYAAPEMSGTEGYGMEADLYSMGVILFALVTGFLPFDDPDHAKLVQDMADENYTIPSHVSEEVAALLRSLLRADPKQRITLREVLLVLYLGRTRDSLQVQLKNHSWLQDEWATPLPKRAPPTPMRPPMAVAPLPDALNRRIESIVKKPPAPTPAFLPAVPGREERASLSSATTSTSSEAPQDSASLGRPLPNAVSPLANAPILPNPPANDATVTGLPMPFPPAPRPTFHRVSSSHSSFSNTSSDIRDHLAAMGLTIDAVRASKPPPARQPVVADITVPHEAVMEGQIAAPGVGRVGASMYTSPLGSIAEDPQPVATTSPPRRRASQDPHNRPWAYMSTASAAPMPSKGTAPRRAVSEVYATGGALMGAALQDNTESLAYLDSAAYTATQENQDAVFIDSPEGSVSGSDSDDELDDFLVRRFARELRAGGEAKATAPEADDDGVRRGMQRFMSADHGEVAATRPQASLVGSTLAPVPEDGCLAAGPVHAQGRGPPKSKPISAENRAESFHTTARSQLDPDNEKWWEVETAEDEAPNYQPGDGAFSACSSRSPHELSQDLAAILNAHMIEFKKKDKWDFACRWLPQGVAGTALVFGLEIFKLPRLDLHVVLYSRKRGDFWLHQKLAAELMAHLEEQEGEGGEMASFGSMSSSMFSSDMSEDGLGLTVLHAVPEEDEEEKKKEGEKEEKGKEREGDEEKTGDVLE